MTVLTTPEAKRVAEQIFGRPISNRQLQALAAAEAAGRKIEGYIGFVATCHIAAAYERALET